MCPSSWLSDVCMQWSWSLLHYYCALQFILCVCSYNSGQVMHEIILCDFLLLKKRPRTLFLCCRKQDCDIFPTLKCSLSICLVFFVRTNWSSVAILVSYITRMNRKHLTHYLGLFLCGRVVWILNFLFSCCTQMQSFPSMRREWFLMESTETRPSLEVKM